MSVDLQLSRALHYGHGCFTTLVYRDGLPLLWEYHWQRLQQAALILGLHCEENALRKQLQQMIDVQTEHAGILKILLLDESPANGYEPPQYAKTQVLILPRVLDRQWLAEKRQKGCQLMRCQYRLAHQ